MKKASIVVFSLGLLAILFFTSPLYFYITNDPLGAGYGVMLFGYPLIILGIVLFGISWFRNTNK